MKAITMDGTGMPHALYCFSTGDPIDVLPMHVVAYAYRDAWRLLHAGEPRGDHLIDGLDLLIAFGQNADR
jgi:hypothetical protein